MRAVEYQITVEDQRVTNATKMFDLCGEGVTAEFYDVDADGRITTCRYADHCCETMRLEPRPIDFDKLPHDIQKLVGMQVRRNQREFSVNGMPVKVTYKN